MAAAAHSGGGGGAAPQQCAPLSPLERAEAFLAYLRDQAGYDRPVLEGLTVLEAGPGRLLCRLKTRPAHANRCAHVVARGRRSGAAPLWRCSPRGRPGSLRRAPRPARLDAPAPPPSRPPAMAPCTAAASRRWCGPPLVPLPWGRPLECKRPPASAASPVPTRHALPPTPLRLPTALALPCLPPNPQPPNPPTPQPPTPPPPKVDIISSAAIVTQSDRGGVSISINTSYLSPAPVGEVGVGWGGLGWGGVGGAAGREGRGRPPGCRTHRPGAQRGRRDLRRAGGGSGGGVKGAPSPPARPPSPPARLPPPARRRSLKLSRRCPRCCPRQRTRGGSGPRCLSRPLACTCRHPRPAAAWSDRRLTAARPRHRLPSFPPRQIGKQMATAVVNLSVGGAPVAQGTHIKALVRGCRAGGAGCFRGARGALRHPPGSPGTPLPNPTPNPLAPAGLPPPARRCPTPTFRRCGS
jgi:hypothetical protein